MNYMKEDLSELRKRAEEINKTLVDGAARMSVDEMESLIRERNQIMKKLGIKAYASIYRE